MAIIFLTLSYLSKRSANKKRAKLKIPKGKITYSDLNIPAKSLFSKKYLLAGKPDYIIKKKNNLIPVEIKTGNYTIPQKNHIMQLASYCQLIEDNFQSFVPYGVIIYPSIDFKIPFNPGIRFELENTIKEMRNSIKSNFVKRKHHDFQKCQNCSMKLYCKEKIN